MNVIGEVVRVDGVTVALAVAGAYGIENLLGERPRGLVIPPGVDLSCDDCHRESQCTVSTLDKCPRVLAVLAMSS